MIKGRITVITIFMSLIKFLQLSRESCCAAVPSPTPRHSRFFTFVRLRFSVKVGVQEQIDQGVLVGFRVRAHDGRERLGDDEFVKFSLFETPRGGQVCKVAVRESKGG